MARRVTVAAVAGLALALAGAPAAEAARKHCNALVDARGDEAPMLAEDVKVERADLDMVSGDVASDSKRVTFVFRLRDLKQAPDTSGGRYTMVLTIGEAQFEVMMLVHKQFSRGELFTYTRTANVVSNEHIAHAPVVVDRARSQLRMTVPLSAVKTFTPVGRGTTAEIEYANAFVSVGEPNPPAPVKNGTLSWQWDFAPGDGRTYPMGAASCVKVGA